MRRREFIALAGAAAASGSWPLALRAQQGRVRHIAVLMGYAEDDPEAQVRIKSFQRGLQELGWTAGTNVRIDYRWAAGDIGRIRIFAKELIALRPDVILANTTPVTRALHDESRTIPIVFVIVSDPVGDGFVASLPRPGGNVTGFINYEASMASKWLELLKEIAPSVVRAALIYNPDTAPGGGSYFWRVFESAAPSLRIEPIAAPVRNRPEIEAVVTALSDQAGGGAVTGFDGFTSVNRETIISLANRNSVPTVSPLRVFSKDGGLVSYGPDYLDLFHRAALYVDRILRGAMPGELPVQVPTKFELVINLKTAKVLGLDVPPTLLATADEVIE
jgi:putative tryptophan/tyrosine transport system substrate-binding protein